MELAIHLLVLKLLRGRLQEYWWEIMVFNSKYVYLYLQNIVCFHPYSSAQSPFLLPQAL